MKRAGIKKGGLGCSIALVIVVVIAVVAVFHFIGEKIVQLGEYLAIPNFGLYFGFSLVILIIILVFYLLIYRPLKLARIPDQLYLSVLPKQFVIVDVETTGLSPDNHEIIEIGAIKVNRDSEMHDTFTVLIRPEMEIPIKITEITGITQELVEKEGFSIEEAIKDFLDFIGDLRLVAYNAKFDFAFLSKAAACIGRKIDNPVSCALEMARCAWPGRKSYKLQSIARDGGLDTTGVHRALNDCKLVMMIYGVAAVELNSIGDIVVSQEYYNRELNRLDSKIHNLLSRAKELESEKPLKAIDIYRDAIANIKEIDSLEEGYRTVRYPINRLSFVLEKLKDYQAAYNEIVQYEQYENYTGLTKTDKEAVIKRKIRLEKKLKSY